MFQTKVLEKITTNVLFSVTMFSNIVPFVRLCGNISYSWTGHR